MPHATTAERERGKLRIGWGGWEGGLPRNRGGWVGGWRSRGEGKEREAGGGEKRGSKVLPGIGANFLQRVADPRL